MISNQTFISLALSNAASFDFKTLIKKQLTRLKLRKRGSFSGSSWLSLALRPVLENDRVKQLLTGSPIMAALLFGSFATLPLDSSYLSNSWSLDQPVGEILVFENPQAVMETQEYTYLLPVVILTGISQSYHAGHPGIDFPAPTGSDVIAMDSGKVKEVIDSRFGYGRHLYIEHPGNLVTLYAHLSKISVSAGDQIFGGQKIGEVGSTGWSTGPHLHFEVLKHGRPVNPLPFLKKDLTYRQQLAATNQGANLLP